MEKDKKLKFKESFKKYRKAGTETKDCKDPCLKNGRADRYCLKCANEIMNPILTTVKKEQTEQLILHGVSKHSELLIAWEQYKKANWYESDGIDVEKLLMSQFVAIYCC